MNVWDCLSDTEQCRANEIITLLNRVREFSCEPECPLKYYFKINACDGIGQAVFFVCEEYGIDYEITDYESW